MWIRTFSVPVMMVLLGAASAASPGPDAAATSQPAGEQVRVVIETAAGDIEVALFPGRAPLSVAQFLAHVDAGDYEGASFYRVTREFRWLVN